MTTATYYDATQVYSRNYGSERLYKRNYCNSLLYTEGVMDFQQTLNAYWVVDNMISYMPLILNSYQKNDLDFFVLEISLNKEQQGYMEVYSEGYIDGEYKEHISIYRQVIEYIDLPTKVDDEITTYKFFVQLSSLEPTTFTMMIPTEY